MGEGTFGPLAGMKVIELAHIMAGPTCGLMLADLGANVIKVEKTNGGDDTRRTLPPDVNGESAAFLMMNRNKRGIALDLKSEKGREILIRLIKDADALIENYRRDTMTKLGLGYEDLKKINPGLIYCEISRLRPHRPLCRPRRLRSYCPEHGRSHGHNRRGTGQPANQGGRTGQRYHCWYSGRARCVGGLCTQTEKRGRGSASTHPSSRPR